MGCTLRRWKADSAWTSDSEAEPEGYRRLLVMVTDARPDHTFTYRYTASSMSCIFASYTVIISYTFRPS